MTLEQLIKSSLDDWTEDVPVPLDLSSSALKLGKRRRSTRRLTAASAAVLVAAAAVSIPLLTAGGHAPARPVPAATHRTSLGPPSLTSKRPPTTVTTAQPPPTAWTSLPLTHASSGNTTISAHPDESPPVHLIAADDLAVSAYFLEATHHHQVTLTWYLYNSTSDTYQRTTWSEVDVEPGLGLAAVLASGPPQKRIGIVDIATGAVIRWIPTTRPVGMVRFSPDGTKLLATTYDGDPADMSANNGSITGFVIVNLVNGYQTVVSSAIGPQRSFPAGVYWTYNGAYIFVIDPANGNGWFFTPGGQAIKAPAHSDSLAFQWGNGANVSPNGRLAVSDAYGGSPTGVKNLATGTTVGTQPVENLQGWANNNKLIAEGCGPGCPNEFHSRLVLVSVDGRQVTPLSGFVHGTSDVSPGQWRVLLTRR